MSKAKVPTFRTDTSTYQASSCGPMRTAAAENRIEVRAVTHGHYYGTSLPEELLPGICTVGYWNAQADQNWNLAWHRNEGLELDYQDSGRNGFATPEHQTVLRSGDLAVTRPWQLHQIGVPHVARGIRVWLILDVGITNPNSKWRWPKWIALTDADKDRLADSLLNLGNPVVNLPKKHAAYWKELLKELRVPDGQTNHSRIAVIVNEIVYSLLETVVDQNHFVPSDTPLVLRIIQDFLRDFEVRPHLLLQNWTLTEMARQCGMSPAGFCSHFREFTNMSPKQYLNQARIKRAQELLTNDPDYPIAHLATDVGFTTSQYFATVFKKTAGVTPSEFVMNLKNAPAVVRRLSQ